MSKEMIKKKYELKTEALAIEFTEALKKLKFSAITLGSGVVSEVKETAKLLNLEKEYEAFSFFLSEYDFSALDVEIKEMKEIKKAEKAKKNLKSKKAEPKKVKKVEVAKKTATKTKVKAKAKKVVKKKEVKSEEKVTS